MVNVKPSHDGLKANDEAANLLREQQREHEAGARGGGAVRAHRVIFAHDGYADGLVPDFQHLSPSPMTLSGRICTTSVKGTIVRTMRFQSSVSLTGITG
jgi:hypothetical protein